MRLFALLALLAVLQLTAQEPAPSLAKDFATTFGPLTVTDDHGTAILTRTQAQVDAGADWRPGGQLVALDAAHDSVTIEPVAALNGAYYVVTLLCCDARGKFVAEVPLIPDTNQPEARTVTGLVALAAQKAPGATHYALRFRVQPVAKTGVAFSFRRITAQPTAP
jgi:hypothetical protein